MSDLISRQDAVDEIRKCRFVVDAIEKIRGLPSAEPQWIPCSERLPKEDEYVGNVCKYYLIQDEYEDMHVAHLSSCGWETIESVNALGCDTVAWMPLPELWKGENNETD